MDEKLIKMRDLFREVADIIDEMEELYKKEQNGEDITKESENIIGRYMIKLLELQKLQ